MKTLIFQVMIGSPAYVYGRAEAIGEFEKYCMPTVPKYCEKHGYDYQLITEYPKDHDPRWFNFNTKPDDFNYRATGKQKASTFVRYLNLNQPEYDRIVSLDCDIYIPDDAEPLPEVKGHMAIQDLGKNWKHMRGAFPLPDDKFVNGGVQMVDRETGKKIYDYMAFVCDNKIMPPIGYKSDQAYINYWRSQNHDLSHRLGFEWNYMVGPWHDPIDVNGKNFIHYAGEAGRFQLKDAIAKGIVK